METQHVQGSDKGRIMLYALSTCVWCRRTKDLLAELGVAFDYTYVDQLPNNEQDAVMGKIGKWNRTGNFPTLVINDEKCIIGFKETDIREALA